ncbi:MAG: ABC transporter permease [Spirochaetia bacterium]
MHALFSKIGRSLRNAWLPIVALILFFVLWEAVVRVLKVPRYILPAFSSVLAQFADNAKLIWHHTTATAVETLVGFAISAALAIPLSIIVAFSRFMRLTLYPAAVTLEMVPKIAFAPIFVVWLGFHFSSKMVVVFLVCFFPILINAVFGFVSLNEYLEYFSQSTGAGPLRTFMRIRFPAALPQIFVGLKGAAINATVGATIAEWVGGNAGLGYFIAVASGTFRTDLALASILTLTALGLALYGLVALAEMRLLSWHISQRQGGG